MARFHDDRHPQGVEAGLQGLGDLGGQALLQLQTPREDVHDAWDFAESDYLAVGYVGDMALAEKRQQVVLAQRKELNVLHQHHLIVVLFIDSVINNGFNAFFIALCQKPQGFRYAAGRPPETVPVRVLADFGEQ